MNIYTFPPPNTFESTAILKKLALAHRYLAELKGIVRSIPNEAILINTLIMQEAKDSSEIENIVTTHDELFKLDLASPHRSLALKEVNDYGAALKLGFNNIKKSGLLRLDDILSIHAIVKANNSGLRRLPGTNLINQTTGEVIYEPPQSHNDIAQLMAKLIEYINTAEDEGQDPLIKMALIHHQFESIHPFYDGNGRVGRIINILYLVMYQLLDIPILYLSRHIIRHKDEYYRLLQLVRDTNTWDEWVLFMLDGVESTAKQGIELVKEIKTQMQLMKNTLRSQVPKIYSQNLLNNLFRHPYTKIAYLQKDLSVSRLTATRYLEELCEKNILSKQKEGRHNYYINEPLCKALTLS